MAAMIGRKLTLKKGTGVSAVAIVGARQDDVTITNGEADITDKGDNGYRTLGDFWTQRSLDVACSGILKDDTLIKIVTSSTGSVLLQEYKVEIDGIGTFAGDFYLNGLTLGAPYNESVTFSGTFMSSGVYTFTPA